MVKWRHFIAAAIAMQATDIREAVRHLELEGCAANTFVGLNQPVGVSTEHHVALRTPAIQSGCRKLWITLWINCHDRE